MDVSYSEDWADFRGAFTELKSKGPVPSVGEGPVSVKATFLAQDGTDSTVFHPDHGELTVYCRRSRTGTPLSGFSKAIVYNPGWNSRELLENYGIPGKNGHSNTLFSTLTTHPNKHHGLHVSTDDANNLILRDERGNSIGLWSPESLKKGFDKHRAFILIEVVETKDGSEKLFEFTGAKLMLRRIELDDMLELERLIEIGLISLELRMFLTQDHLHCVNRGLEADRVRDHGTAWRYANEALDELFDSIPID